MTMHQLLRRATQALGDTAIEPDELRALADSIERRARLIAKDLRAMADARPVRRHHRESA